jgi:hypothetical protein
MQEESTLQFKSPTAGYTPRQRWMVLTSVGVLALIGVSIAFASGVYIGNNRELAPGAAPSFPGQRPNGPGPQGPGQQAQPQGIQGGQQGVPGVQGGVPQQQGAGGAPQPVNFALTGGFVARDGAMLVLAAPGGELRVAIDAETRFARDGQAVAAADVQPGVQLGIRYRQGTATADLVQVITGRGPAPGQPGN